MVDSDPKEFHFVEMYRSGLATDDIYDMGVAVERKGLGGEDMVSMLDHGFVNNISLCGEIARR